MEILTVDALDRQILHALGLDGRMSFSRLAEFLGVSDQTVARRYRRLRTRGAIRVVGLCDHRRTGGSSWWVRLQCAPGSVPSIAHALAGRPDTQWVQILSGGTEVLCGVRWSGSEPRTALLLDKLPRTGRITAVTTHSMLHQFAGGSLRSGAELIAGLTDDQARELSPGPPPPIPDDPIVLTDLDQVLFAALAEDARVGHAELAARTGWSESTVRRRMDQLHEAGVLYYDLEIDCAILGLNTQAWLWLTVHPAELAAVGAELARHPEVPFAAATTGPTNLAASVACRNPEALYTYLTDRIGPLPGVQNVEAVPITRTVKQGGAVLPALAPTARTA